MNKQTIKANINTNILLVFPLVSFTFQTINYRVQVITSFWHVRDVTCHLLVYTRIQKRLPRERCSAVHHFMSFFIVTHKQSARRMVHLTNKQQRRKRTHNFSAVRYWSALISHIEAIINCRFLFNFVVNWFLNVFILLFHPMWSDQLITIILMAPKKAQVYYSLLQLISTMLTILCFSSSLIAWLVRLLFEAEKKYNENTN